MSGEPVDKLSEVLLSLQEIQETSSSQVVRVSVAAQVDTLREVQREMQRQLLIHDAQIASLRELIMLLAGPDK